MAYELSEQKKQEVLNNFNETCLPLLDNELLSDKFGRKVERLEIEPLMCREDGKTNFYKAVVYFSDGKEEKFWKHYLDWGLTTNRSGTFFKNPFTQRNDEIYLNILNEKGFAPKHDWTHSFKLQE